MKTIAILVDEPAVRDLVAGVLKRKGFTVDEFSACLEPKFSNRCTLGCRPDGETPVLVILDATAPRSCSGIEAAQKILRRWPDTKILFTSGGPKEALPDRRLFAALPKSSYGFLPKPFTDAGLLRAVERLIRQRD